MGITVREIWELKEFQRFRLVAGESGLDNRIEKVGILDYEFALQDNTQPRKWTFRKHDFIISSLLFAKGQPELLMPAVRELCKDQVSALAVKNVCYQTLPQEVLDYADQHGLPIFMFGRDDAYFEEIVTFLKHKIKERNDLEGLEHKIALFLNGELDIKKQRELNREVLLNREQPYRFAYCFIREQSGKIRNHRNYYLFREGSRNYRDTFYYKDGCFAVMYGAEAGESERIFLKWKEYLQPRLRLPMEKYWIGIGEVHEDPEQLLLAMQESFYAYQYCRLFEQHKVFFRNMGIYKMLLPCSHIEWVRNYSSDIVCRILKFDREYGGDLYKTIKQYVKCHGNVGDIAEKMHLHKNTVRYRVNKIRELLDMEEDGDFDLQISIAFLADELKQQLG